MSLLFGLIKFVVSWFIVLIVGLVVEYVKGLLVINWDDLVFELVDDGIGIVLLNCWISKFCCERVVRFFLMVILDVVKCMVKFLICDWLCFFIYVIICWWCCLIDLLFFNIILCFCCFFVKFFCMCCFNWE